MQKSILNLLSSLDLRLIFHLFIEFSLSAGRSLALYYSHKASFTVLHCPLLAFCTPHLSMWNKPSVLFWPYPKDLPNAHGRFLTNSWGNVFLVYFLLHHRCSKRDDGGQALCCTKSVPLAQQGFPNCVSKISDILLSLHPFSHNKYILLHWCNTLCLNWSVMNCSHCHLYSDAQPPRSAADYQ